MKNNQFELVGKQFKLVCLAEKTNHEEDKEYLTVTWYKWEGLAVLFGENIPPTPFFFHTQDSRLDMDFSVHMLFAALDKPTEMSHRFCPEDIAVDMLGEKVLGMFSFMNLVAHVDCPTIEIPYLDKDKILIEPLRAFV